MDEIRLRMTVALGGHLVMGRDQKETEDLYQGFEESTLPTTLLISSDGSAVEGAHQQVFDEVNRLQRPMASKSFFFGTT